MANKRKQFCATCNDKGGIQDFRMVDESLLTCPGCGRPGIAKDIEPITIVEPIKVEEPIIVEDINE